MFVVILTNDMESGLLPHHLEHFQLTLTIMVAEQRIIVFFKHRYFIL